MKQQGQEGKGEKSSKQKPAAAVSDDAQLVGEVSKLLTQARREKLGAVSVMAAQTKRP